VSLLESLLAPVGYAGDVLDKVGGRAIRGTLAGKPRELLSPIPFSDTLGITDPSQVTRGHELAQKWGWTRPDDVLGNVAAGLGIETATDPLTYLAGLGAIRHLGRAAKAAEVAEAPSRFSILKGMREPVALVKDLGGPGERVVGGSSMRVHFTPDEIRAGAKSLAEEYPDYAGAMVRDEFGHWGFSKADAPFGTEPHELAHAMVHTAREQGVTKELPFFGRMASGLYGDPDMTRGFRRTLAEIASEMNSMGIERRKTQGYLGGALKWAYDPWFHQAYDPAFAKGSPLATAVFHTAPGAIPGAAAGAASGAGLGYEQGGIGGILPGTLAGALTGAAGGGLASHLRYSPRMFNRPLTELERLAESAGKTLPRMRTLPEELMRRGTTY
jgi:hypothetical protein